MSQAQRLRANLNCCFQGVIPVGKGFIVTEAQVQAWVKADPKNEQVLKLFSMGDNLASNPHGKPERWIIDFANTPIEEASEYKLPFEHVRTHVKPERDKNRRDIRRLNWWKHGEVAPKMRAALAPLDFCFAVPRVSKWAIFIPFSTKWLPGDLSTIFAQCDYYILGILTSDLHRQWVKAQSSTLEDRTRYTHNTCFETFPCPQMSSPLTPLPNGEGNKSDQHSSLPGRNVGDEGVVQHIRASALELHTYRTQQMEAKQWGITKLYNAFFHEPTSQLHKLHAKLDALVLQAYGFSPTDDLLDQLLSLNLALAERERQNLPVLGPAAPHSSFPNQGNKA